VKIIHLSPLDYCFRTGDCHHTKYTQVEDPNDTAVALYTVGMNFVNNKPPLEDTNYKFDETGFIIRIPYRGTLSANH
jgi:hypothetical protein